MRFLQSERSTLDAVLPGLDKRLAEAALPDLERAGGPGLAAFKDAGGPALLVPAEHGGRGADLVTAVRVQRAIGARSPSLAVAATMHHFSVASLVELASGDDGMEWMLLAAIARDSLLMASGFAEGSAGQSILRPTLTAHAREDGYVLNGSKKPCSLSRSMDLLTASVAVPDGDGQSRLAVAVIPADSPGISVRPFWNTPALAGAESDEVVLDDVVVPADLVVRTEPTDDGRLDRLQQVGFIWFELLMAASYLGAVSALVERLLDAPRAEPATQAQAATTVQAAMRMVEGVAADGTRDGEDALANALLCRYATQDAVTRTADLAMEALGGMAFVCAPDVAYLAAACRALAFHPPNRARMAEPLRDYFTGAALRIP